jgi:hypothetical protein
VLAVAQDSEGLREYTVKAQFLGGLASYTRWPKQGSPTDPSTPFRVCVLGKSPFEGSLERIWSNKTILSRPVQIRYIRSLANLEDCDVLFICSSETDELEKILTRIKGKPILTVGDTHEYGRRGVMVNFYLESTQIRMEVNMASASRAGITFSSHFLKLTRIVQESFSKLEINQLSTTAAHHTPGCTSDL